jgi:hypothetical protein
MRSTVDAIRNFQDHEGQLQQDPHDKDTDKQTHDSCDKIDEAFGGGVLHADHDVNDESDSAAKDRKDIKQLHYPAGEPMIECKIKKTCKEILLIRHVASWQSYGNPAGAEM